MLNKSVSNETLLYLIFFILSVLNFLDFSNIDWWIIIIGLLITYLLNSSNRFEIATKNFKILNDENQELKNKIEQLEKQLKKN